MDVPFVDLSRLVARVRADALVAWDECLRACTFVGGGAVTELEGKISAVLGVPRVVACANGTDALVVALQAAGVGRGSKVALPNLTFWATFEAVAQLGAVPVLIDVDPDDLQMSLAELRTAHEAHGLDAAVLVHLYGWTSAELHEIRAFCAEQAILLVEDGAQCFGVEVFGEPLLSRAQTATLSFYPSKVVGGAMDGGAIVVQDDARAALVRSLCDHGRSAHYAHAYVGRNSKMAALQATFLSRVLDEVPEILASRRAAEAWYRARFSGDERIRVYGPPSGVTGNGYMNVLTVRGRSGASVGEALSARGIGSGRTYPQTIDAQPPAKAAGAIAHGDLRWSRHLCEGVVNLPLFYGIREDEREAAAQVLLEVIR